MTALFTESTASALIALQETDGATLTQLARATGRPVSTVQRAIDRLITAGVVQREGPRGVVRVAPGAPTRALRELAEWQLGPAQSAVVRREARSAVGTGPLWPPATITNPAIRAAWPTAIRTIVEQFNPALIILFGSQARGDSRPDSDVDLLVVMDGEIDRREQQVRIARALAGMPFSKDILVTTTANFDHPMAGTALAEATRDGVRVYER